MVETGDTPDKDWYLNGAGWRYFNSKN